MLSGSPFQYTGSVITHTDTIWSVTKNGQPIWTDTSTDNLTSRLIPSGVLEGGAYTFSMQYRSGSIVSQTTSVTGVVINDGVIFGELPNNIAPIMSIDTDTALSNGLLQLDGNGNITLSADSNKLYLYEKRQLAIKYIKENASIVPDGVLNVKIPNILNNI